MTHEFGLTPAKRARLRGFLAGMSLVATAAYAISLLGCIGPSSRSTAAAANGAGVASATRDANGWFVISLGGASRVSLPKQPTVASSTSRLADGARLVSNSFQTAFGNARYMMTVNDVEGGIPGDPLDAADALLDGFVDELSGYELTAADAIVRNGHPGTSAELRNEREHVVLHLQVFAGRSRLYLFGEAVLGDGIQSTAVVQARTTFFESIDLDREDAPSPDGTGQLDFTAFAAINPPEAGISVELPGSAKRESRTLEIDDETVRVFEYSTTSSDRLSSMAARVYLFDERPEGVLERLRELAANGSGTATPPRPAQRQGYGGQAYMIESPTQIRYVLDLIVGGGAVQLVHTVPRGQEAAQAEFRRRFLNSLRIH